MISCDTCSLMRLDVLVCMDTNRNKTGGVALVIHLHYILIGPYRTTHRYPCILQTPLISQRRRSLKGFFCIWVDYMGMCIESFRIIPHAVNREIGHLSHRATCALCLMHLALINAPSIRRPSSFYPLLPQDHSGACFGKNYHFHTPESRAQQKSYFGTI